MKILLLHQYFKTPSEGGGIRSYYIAKAMVRAGHQVTVMTSGNGKTRVDSIDGIEIVYLHVSYSNHFSFLRRLWAFFIFYQKAHSKTKSIERVDLVYAISTPLSVGWLGKVVSRRMKVRFFFEVGDLWPEVPIQMGIIKNPMLKKWLYNIEEEIYRSAETVVALSSGMVSHIESKGASKVLVVPNMADISFFSDLKEITPRNDNFKIGYFGTIGMANHLEYLLDLAELSQEESLGLEFLIVGDGARKPAISKEIILRELENTTLLPWQDMVGVKQLMGECDAVYISFQNIPVLHTGSPNKFFDGLAAGKIIVSNLGGWSKTIIEENEVGICYDPMNPNEFIEKIQPLLNDVSRVSRLKENASRLAKSSFDKTLLTQKILDEIG
ncbi:MAG: glycosyltransferase family 4 protein [Cyclobacteriaceae bacterium]